MLNKDVDFFQMIYHFFADGTKLTYAAIGVGLFVAFLYFKIFFGDVTSFDDDAKKSNELPLLDKDYDYVDSRWSNNKILIWIALSVGSGMLAYNQLPGLFPNWFKTL